MDKEKLRQHLLRIFFAEFERYLGTLNEDLLGLERGEDGAQRAERIERLHRDTHGLKGAARAAGVPAVQRACRVLESLLAETKDGRRAFDTDMSQLLRAAEQAFGESLARITDNQDGGGPLIEALLSRLEAGTPVGAGLR